MRTVFRTAKKTIPSHLLMIIPHAGKRVSTETWGGGFHHGAAQKSRNRKKHTTHTNRRSFFSTRTVEITWYNHTGTTTHIISYPENRRRKRDGFRNPHCVIGGGAGGWYKIGVPGYNGRWKESCGTGASNMMLPVLTWADTSNRGTLHIGVDDY